MIDLSFFYQNLLLPLHCKGYGAHVAPSAVRPDIPSVSLATIALLIYIFGVDKKSLLLIATSSIVFFLSWSFKQSSVWIFAGTSLCSLIYVKKTRQAFALIFPSALMMMICLLIGGDIYKYNIINLPSISIFSIQQSVNEFTRIFLPNLAIWGGDILLAPDFD